MSLAAWYNGRGFALGLAVVLPLVRLSFYSITNAPWSFAEAAVNAGIRMIVLGLFAFLVDRGATQREALSRRVHTLERFLPVCTVCKRIRDEASATWQPVEQFLLMPSKAPRRSHICPDCAREVEEAFDRR